MKKKLANYWYYYKWHTIAGLFAAVFLTVSAVQCAGQSPADAVIYYAGEKSIFLADVRTDIQKCYDEIMKRLPDGGDVNDDGLPKLVFNEFSFDVSDTESPHNDDRRKFENELINDRCFVYMFDLQTYEHYNRQKLFQPLSAALGIAVELLPTDCMYDENAVMLHLLKAPFAFEELVGTSPIFCEDRYNCKKLGLADYPEDTVICVRKADTEAMEDIDKYEFYENSQDFLSAMLYYPDTVPAR